MLQGFTPNVIILTQMMYFSGKPQSLLCIMKLWNLAKSKNWGVGGGGGRGGKYALTSSL